jgi:hypothetical protein
MAVKIKLPLILNCEDTLRIHPSTSLLQPRNSVPTYVSDNHMMTFTMESTQVHECRRGNGTAGGVGKSRHHCARTQRRGMRNESGKSMTRNVRIM